MSIENQCQSSLALQRSAMSDNLTYRSAGAETSVRMTAINILLRWSKDSV